MGSIFKKFGQGIMYILVLPIFLLAVALFGVYGVFLFIVLMIKSIICFFKGKSIFADLPEDIEAQRRLHPERAEPNKNVIIEERDPVVVIDRKEEEHPYSEDRYISRSESPRLEDREIDSIEDKEEDYKFSDDAPIFIEEKEEDINLEEYVGDEKEEPIKEDEEYNYDEEIDEPEDEEEDIPFLDENKSNIEEDDGSDESSSSGILFSDWRDK